MLKAMSIVVFGVAAAPMAACGTNGNQPGVVEPQQATPTCVGPPSNPDCWLAVKEHSFIKRVAPVTDGLSTAIVNYTPGRFCMSGTLDPGQAGTNWGALLLLALADGNPARTGIVAPFDAAARGISQVRFTLENLPDAGLQVSIAEVQRRDCLDIPACLTAASFYLKDDLGSPRSIGAATTITVPLSSFTQPNWGDTTLSFDPELIVGLQFVAVTLPGMPVSYDFCVRDVKLLDAAGREVNP